MIVGILLIVASIGGAALTGAGFEWLALLLIGYVVTATFYAKRLYGQFQTKSFLRAVLLTLISSIAIFIGSFIMVQILIASAGKWNQHYTSEYLLVPGAGIIRKEPSFTLAGRLDTAIHYLLNNPETKVIVSGGLSDGQLASEAQVMAWYLEKHNIGSDRIILEEKASNTMENILFSKKQVEDLYNQSLNEIIIITSDYHMLRSQMIARRVGMTAEGIKSSSPPDLYQQYAVREYFAIFKSMLLDWP